MRSAKTFGVFAIILCVYAASFSMPSTFGKQTGDDDGIYSIDFRPFDFADKYYKKNGIQPEFIIGRRTGIDKFSVFDAVNSEKHREVRIKGTSPAYRYDGEILYWAFYGDLFESGFAGDITGRNALEAANRLPVYFFPSTDIKGTERQAVLIDDRGNVPEKNPLGLAVAVIVEYTRLIRTKSGAAAMARLSKRNGLSIDRTPIIRTADEIAELNRKGLVTLRMRGLNDARIPPFLIVNILRNPVRGTISPDAFLMFVEKGYGRPLAAEYMFLETFDCLQKTGDYCATS